MNSAGAHPVGTTSKALPCEAGSPLSDQRAFRRCLAQYPTGVAIMTAVHKGRHGGVTANSFASLSMDPPLVMWALQKTSQSFDIFASAPHFAVNILATDQIDLSQKFAKSGPDKFAGVGFDHGVDGAPILHGAAGVLECTCHARHDAGDHVLLIGRVEKFTRFETGALVFENGRYATTIEHPVMRSRRMPAEEPRSRFHHLFVVLLSRAYNHMRQMMENARQRRGLDFNESRLLSIIPAYPGRSFDGVLPATFLARSSAEDALASLTERGLVEHDAAGALALTAVGDLELRALMHETQAIEDGILSRIPPNELEITRKTLAALVATDGLGVG